MVTNWPGLVVGLTLTLLFGLFALLAPIGVARLMARWSKFAISKTVGVQNARPRLRDALRLIDDDPVEYARRFRYQLIIIRLTGIFALLLFAAGLLLVFAMPTR